MTSPNYFENRNTFAEWRQTPRSDSVKPSSQKITASELALSALFRWSESDGEATAVSNNGKILLEYGYKFVFKRYDAGHGGLILRRSTHECIEIQTLIAYPDRKGIGSAMMAELCDVADEFRTSLWLDAYPFGKMRQHISVTKLRAFYSSFGFFTIKRPLEAWKTGFHKWDCTRFENVMMRNPF